MNRCKDKKYSRDFPPKLKEFINGFHCERVDTFIPTSNVIRLISSDRPNLFLKFNSCNCEMPLKAEMQRLEWISNKLNVPRVLYYENFNGIEFLLVSEVEGTDASKFTSEGILPEIVSKCAKGLRLIHEIDISNCRFDNFLESKIAQAKRRMKEGLVDESDFNDSQKTAQELFEELQRKIPDNEDLVFTHGDYCLPNIIINNDEIGFVDWSRAGIADRYQDLALVYRSLKYNYGEKWHDLFFNKYGIENPDMKKIYYYCLMDEFF